MQIVSERGAGSPVLLLHGSPSTPEAFEPFASALVPSYRVLFGALPGYGGVPALVPYDINRVHAGVETALASAIDQPLDLVGFSSGSYHALAVALRGKVPVRSVVLLGGLPGVPDAQRSEYLAVAEAVRAGAVPPETFPARMLSAAFRAAHPEAAQQVLEWTAATTLDVLAEEIAAMARAPSLLDALGRAEFRLLARVGELDLATPPAFSEAIVRAARSGTLEVVTGAGHALIVEDVPRTQQSVLRFLAAGPR